MRDPSRRWDDEVSLVPPRDRAYPAGLSFTVEPVDRDAPGRALAVALIAEGRLEPGEVGRRRNGRRLAWYRLTDSAYESYARVVAEKTALADWN